MLCKNEFRSGAWYEVTLVARSPRVAWDARMNHTRSSDAIPVSVQKLITRTGNSDTEYDVPDRFAQPSGA